jgi:indolepyruvate ferredoxin oxidoreductase alpha subunit
MPAAVAVEPRALGVVLLGDEAVARAAIDAGVSAAYAYPGTPATEILEYLLRHSERSGKPHAAWCANEKTAYEEALGVSMVGRRALVCMKHVGLNVAADPFINSAIVTIGGGLVLAVADDPSMHSSQNEQDSRFYADFARVMCLEPADQQQAYDMTREAFEISERFAIPVVVRLVTRLAHSRAVVRTGETRSENALAKPAVRDSWVLLPSNARRLWRRLLELQPQMRELSERIDYNRLDLRDPPGGTGVITAGIARTYYEECVGELDPRPSHLHIGAYPAPADKIRALARHVREILVLEDGYPFLERQLLGILPPALEVRGRVSGHLPAAGELDPDIVRRALSLPRSVGASLPHPRLPGRPPQLCAGCPHGDSFAALAKALSGHDRALVTSDIGCYTLGALPPYSAIESCVCMGASIGMAKGAAEAGFFPVVAVIGDSTFLHSGVTPLMDVVAAGADVTVLILDNEVVAMTGAQPTLLPTERLGALVRGLGVPPDHVHVIEAHPRRIGDMAAVLRREIEHHGPSVVIATRECIEAAKRRKALAR